MLDSFDLHKNQQIYPCMVHKPLGISLAKFRTKVPKNKLPENILKLMLIHILLALDFLHAKAKIIHAGKTLLQIVFVKALELTSGRPSREEHPTRH